jgi:hypothetical protein
MKAPTGAGDRSSDDSKAMDDKTRIAELDMFTWASGKFRTVPPVCLRRSSCALPFARSCLLFGCLPRTLPYCEPSSTHNSDAAQQMQHTLASPSRCNKRPPGLELAPPASLWCRVATSVVAMRAQARLPCCACSLKLSVITVLLLCCSV